MIITSVAYLVSTRASVIAEYQPPTTATFFPLKKGASQGAQVDTPRPISSFSPGTPNHLSEAPVAIITVREEYFVPPAISSRGFLLKSTDSTFFWINSAPNLSACSLINLIKSGPSTPSGKPGKLSTVVVSISCPPQISPPRIIVEAAPRVV